MENKWTHTALCTSLATEAWDNTQCTEHTTHHTVFQHNVSLSVKEFRNFVSKSKQK